MKAKNHTVIMGSDSLLSKTEFLSLILKTTSANGKGIFQLKDANLAIYHNDSFHVGYNYGLSLV